MNRITSSVVPIAVILIGSLVMTNRPRPMHPDHYTAAVRRLNISSVRTADVFGIELLKSQRRLPGAVAHRT